ncbi:MAG TPA: PIG-L deacetylase family protein [Bacteroidota bacterium]|nr:PIG-L deacetylase family protein [Bacteroidota bacterium]
MLTSTLGVKPAEPLSILCLGAHSDDIEIGCGGTILKLLALHPQSRLTWVVFSAAGSRADEARRGAACFSQQSRCADVRVLSFRDGFFPYEGVEIKEYFETLKSQIQPDLVFTHYRQDRHQDHRIISDFTWNTFRNHLIFEYEIPKFDGDFGQPNMYVRLDDEAASAKCAAVMETFVSQKIKHWLSEDLLFAVLRIRGMEAGGSTRYAEAFYSRKMTL